MKTSLNRAASLIVSTLLVAGCGSSPGSGGSQAGNSSAADTIYQNGAIYTVDAQNSWAEAMAVSGGKIVAIGKNADVEGLRGPSTKLVDLKGAMVMPGIEDMHGHPMLAGTAQFYECSFPFSLTMDQILDKVRSCATSTPKGQWIRGGQWANELIASSKPPHKKLLDAISTDHPIFLGDSTVHDSWVNSKALEVLGITKSTPNPKGGVIDRDPNGEPNGVLHDNATFQTMQKLPPYTAEQYAKALKWAMEQMNQVGVTVLKDAQVDSYTLRAYHDLDTAGNLPMKVQTSLAWRGSWTESHEKEVENIKNRNQYRSARVNPDFIKIFLDGIPPTRTAAMLEPYVPDKKHGANFRGELIHPEDELTRDVIELDKEGMTIKIHSTGDRAVRVSLNAFEAARKANGDSGLRHEVAHAELISPEDIPRFKALNVTAEMCPMLWYRSPLVDLMATIIGEKRANQFWPIKTVVDSGALVTYGSDWPSVVKDPSPWPGIEAMITRRDPYTNKGEPLWAEQAIDLPTAVKIFTRNGSVAAKLGNETGSLERGKAADFIVLDRNIFKVPVEDISETKVLSTVIDGKEVYKAK